MCDIARGPGVVRLRALTPQRRRRERSTSTHLASQPLGAGRLRIPRFLVIVDKMLKRHLPNVLTYFRHRITNAMSEGVASKIQGLKKAAAGFRNRDNFKTSIYFHCGGLDLYPDPTH